MNNDELQIIQDERTEVMPLLSAAEHLDAWPTGEYVPGQNNALRSLDFDLILLVIFLALSDKGITKKLVWFINEVLYYNADTNSIKQQIQSVESQYDGDNYCDIILQTLPSVFLDACSAEDELADRGIKLKTYPCKSLPEKIKRFFYSVGKAFLGENYSDKEILALGTYIIHMDKYLAEYGYYNNN